MDRIIGEALKELVNQRNKSGAEVGRAIGATGSQIYRMYSDKDMKMSTLVKLSKALDAEFVIRNGEWDLRPYDGRAYSPDEMPLAAALSECERERDLLKDLTESLKENNELLKEKLSGKK